MAPTVPRTTTFDSRDLASTVAFTEVVPTLRALKVITCCAVPCGLTTAELFTVQLGTLVSTWPALFLGSPVTLNRSFANTIWESGITATLATTLSTAIPVALTGAMVSDVDVVLSLWQPSTRLSASRRAAGKSIERIMNGTVHRGESELRCRPVPACDRGENGGSDQLSP